MAPPPCPSPALRQRGRKPRPLSPCRAAAGGREGGVAAAIGLALLAVAAAPAHAADRPALRVCADPDNLPFSSSATGGDPGLYVELGRGLAEALGRSYEPVWGLSYFGKRAVRTTLLAKTCDAYVGLTPSSDFMGPKLIYSRPFAEVGFTLVVARDSGAQGLADLAHRRVAVQFASPPQSVLAEHPEIESVTFLDPDAAMAALAAGKVDAAFIWGPSAGYANATRLHNAYRLIPAEGEGMHWPIAIAFRREDGSLRDQVDQALDAARPLVERLEAKYGFPAAPPPARHGAAEARLIPASYSPADYSPTVAAAGDAPAPFRPATGDKAIAEGHELFNGTCAHCHGPDAVQSERRINLRLLQHRYGDTMDELFYTTVTHGRPAKGMPNWSGVFTDEEFAKILAYLHSVQEEQQ